MSDEKKAVKAFIVENFLFGEGDDLRDETSFLDEGIVDSTGILELVNFIEEKFNITVDDDDLVPENLDSINKVVNYIRGKKGR